jgi:hypothetical protein
MSVTEPTIMTPEEVWQAIAEEATPIDFQALITTGVLEKDGAWYKILNKDAMPRHALMKIKTMQVCPKKGTRVKFRTTTKRAANLLKKRPSPSNSF